MQTAEVTHDLVTCDLSKSSHTLLTAAQVSSPASCDVSRCEAWVIRGLSPVLWSCGEGETCVVILLCQVTSAGYLGNFQSSLVIPCHRVSSVVSSVTYYHAVRKSNLTNNKQKWLF